MNQTSTLFLNNITSVDHAYIDSHGHIHGGSFSPMITVTGQVDPHEAVVVDFSNIKKTIKEIIDDKENGWDHKLLILESSKGKFSINRFDDFYIMDTPYVSISGPINSMKRIYFADEHYMISVCADMEHTLQEKLSIHYGFPIQVKVYYADYSASLQDNWTTASFSYVHGLKNSSSWGCQNIAHGHLSFIGLVGGYDKQATQTLANDIANYYNDSIFVWTDNVSLSFKNQCDLGYKSERGFFSMTLKFKNKFEMMSTETTIENIAKHVYNMWESRLREAGVTALHVSEGQNKGSSIIIS
jgi:6-pyruvoyl-tetrahydropterin synthase